MIGIDTEYRQKIALGSDFHLGGTPTGGEPITFETFERELLNLPNQNVEYVLIGGDLFHHIDTRGATLYDVAHVFTSSETNIIATPGNHEEVASNATEIAEVFSSLPNCTLLKNTGVIVDINQIKIGIIGTTGIAGGFGRSMFASHPYQNELYGIETRNTMEGIDQTLKDFEERNIDMLLVLSHYPLLEAEGYEAIPKHASHVGLQIAQSRIQTKEVFWGHFHTDILPRCVEEIPATNIAVNVILKNEGTLFTIRTPQKNSDGSISLEKDALQTKASTLPR